MNKKIEEVSRVQRIHWWSPDGRGVRSLGEKGDKVEKNESVVTQWSQDETHSLGNTVRNTVMTAQCQVGTWNIRGIAV